MPVYSHSRIASFENCPLQYKFRYIDKVEIAECESVETFLGSRVHEAIQKIYDDVNKGKHNTREEILAFYHESWKKQWHDRVVIVEKGLVQENYRSVGETCVQDYYNRHAPFTDGKTIGIEYPVNIDLTGSGRYKIRGYIDRLVKRGDGEYEIHDYKTNKSLPTQEEKDVDRQLALYQIGIQKSWPDVREVTLVWHFVRFDTIIRSKRTSVELEELRQVLAAKIDEIEAAVARDDFPANKSPLCNYCDYKPICPMWRHELLVEQLPANEFLRDDGVTLVNKYAEFEEKKKGLKIEVQQIEQMQQELEEALFAFGDKNNMKVIVGSNHQVELKRSMKVDVPTKNKHAQLRQELENLLRDLPVWKEISDLAPAKLKRLMDEGGLDRDLAAKVREFLIESEEKKITLGKKK
jgi:putative RecB family exonuclease